MKTIGKKMKEGKLSVILLVALMLLVCCFAAACDDGEKGGHVDYDDVQGYVRGVDFQGVAQAKICYDGEVKATAGEDGTFTISVPRQDDSALTGKITLDGVPSLAYFDYNGGKQLVIIKLEEGMQVTDFYFVSGKVVEYYNGETAVDGSVLMIDGNVVKTFSADGNDRNFDLTFVHKDSLITAYKDGYTCHLEVYGPEITGIPVANLSENVTETKTLCVNGSDATVKVIGGGLTFRLKLIEA